MSFPLTLYPWASRLDGTRLLDGKGGQKVHEARGIVVVCTTENVDEWTFNLLLGGLLPTKCEAPKSGYSFTECRYLLPSSRGGSDTSEARRPTPTHAHEYVCVCVRPCTRVRVCARSEDSYVPTRCLRWISGLSKLSSKESTFTYVTVRNLICFTTGITL